MFNQTFKQRRNWKLPNKQHMERFVKLSCQLCPTFQLMDENPCKYTGIHVGVESLLKVHPSESIHHCSGGNAANFDSSKWENVREEVNTMREEDCSKRDVRGMLESFQENRKINSGDLLFGSQCPRHFCWWQNEVLRLRLMEKYWKNNFTLGEHFSNTKQWCRDDLQR